MVKKIPKYKISNMEIVLQYLSCQKLAINNARFVNDIVTPFRERDLINKSDRDHPWARVA